MCSQAEEVAIVDCSSRRWELAPRILSPGVMLASCEYGRGARWVRGEVCPCRATVSTLGIAHGTRPRLLALRLACRWQ